MSVTTAVNESLFLLYFSAKQACHHQFILWSIFTLSVASPRSLTQYFSLDRMYYVTLMKFLLQMETCLFLPFPHFVCDDYTCFSTNFHSLEVQIGLTHVIHCENYSEKSNSLLPQSN